MVGDKIGRKPKDPVVPLWLLFAIVCVVALTAWLVFCD